MMPWLSKKYRGVVVPMITPFNSNKEIDLSAALRIVDYLIKNGASPFILGTTGESASIPDQQRQAFVDAIVRATAGRTLVYAGIASNCLEASAESARCYFNSGIDVVVAHLPSYYPLTEDQMLNYFKKLAEKITGPLVIYNIPSTTHMSIPLTVIDQLSSHANVVGLKDSERDAGRLGQAIQLFKDRSDFSYLVGWAAQSSYALSNGADGIVPSSGNIVPGMYRHLYLAAKSGDTETAETLQLKTDEISIIYQKDRNLSQSLSALKVIMHEMGLCETYVLPPLIESSAEETSRIQEDMRQLKLYENVSKAGIKIK
jgi:dihydrodipicolinate synthase/N-acetylneuraminate lyase